MVAAVLAVIVATAGLVAAAEFDKRVTLDVDGAVTTTRTSANTVDELLTSKGIEPSGEDKVSHELTDELENNDTVKVRYAKQVSVVVDGESDDRVTHATTVEDVLDERDVDVDEDAYLSAKPDSRINRYGDEIVVSNPKNLTVTADGESTEVKTNKPTVADVLDEAGVKLDDDDEIKPGLEDYVAQDAKLKVVRIEKVTKTETVPIDFEVEVSEDADLPKGEKEVVTKGKAGEAKEKVNLVLADGKVREREVVSRDTVRKPVAQVEKRGTKESESESAPGEPVPSGSVWDKIAQCESGGDWHINTGNGYYGGLQFSLQTWRSVGGPGYPHEHSRETQIHYAEILQQRAGWGQWGCAHARFN